MKKITVLSLAASLVFSGALFADDKNSKSSKHYSNSTYGDRNFNGHYVDRYGDRRRSYYRDQYEHDEDFHDDWDDSRSFSLVKRARVVDVQPIYRQVSSHPRSHQECWTERHYKRRSNKDGAVLGAVIGGVIGYNTGGSRQRSKNSGAAVGAVLGSVIGSKAGKNKHYRERHCETVYDRGYNRDQLVGYNVTYKYEGRHYHTMMRERPGRYIDLRIMATPVASSYR